MHYTHRYGNRRKKTELDATTNHRLASREEYVQCQCRALKDFVITNALTGESFGADNLCQNLSSSNGILQSIRWDCHFSHTVPKQMSATTKAGIEQLSHHLDYFRSKPVNIAKITIFLDHGYDPERIFESIRSPLAANHDEDSLAAGCEAHQSRKSSPWQNRICSSCNSVDH